MYMLPGTIESDKLDIREPLGMFAVYYSTLPFQGYFVPPDGVIKFCPFKYLGLYFLVLHHKLKPVRPYVEEVLRILEKSKGLSSRHRQDLLSRDSDNNSVGFRAVRRLLPL